MKKVKLLISAIMFLNSSLFPFSAKADWFGCVPTEVMELPNRIHVKCSNAHAIGGQRIRYVAIGKSDLRKTHRFINFAGAAMTSEHVFKVDIPSSSDSNVGGCKSNDCRTPTAFGVSR